MFHKMAHFQCEALNSSEAPFYPKDNGLGNSRNQTNQINQIDEIDTSKS
jgi:hypothetical protein